MGKRGLKQREREKQSRKGARKKTVGKKTQKVNESSKKRVIGSHGHLGKWSIKNVQGGGTKKKKLGERVKLSRGERLNCLPSGKKEDKKVGGRFMKKIAPR